MEQEIKLKWVELAESRYHLHTEDGYALAVIVFNRSKQAWHIRLVKKYHRTPLNTKLVDEAKEFATEFLSQENITNAEWQEEDETSHYLYNTEGKWLVIIDFDEEVQKWFAKIRQKEYKTLLDKKIGLDQPEKVKKLTEDLIKAEQACHYKYVINKFNTENTAHIIT